MMCYITAVYVQLFKDRTIAAIIGKESCNLESCKISKFFPNEHDKDDKWFMPSCTKKNNGCVAACLNKVSPSTQRNQRTPPVNVI